LFLLPSARRLPAAPFRFSSGCNGAESAGAAIPPAAASAAAAGAAFPPASRIQFGFPLPLSSHILLNEKLLRATSWSLLKLLPPTTIKYRFHIVAFVPSWLNCFWQHSQCRQPLDRPSPAATPQGLYLALFAGVTSQKNS
jgi:hypothetical protein